MTTAWELAGLTLDGRIPSIRLAVSATIALDGPWLRSRALQGGDRLVPIPPDLLLRFTRITNADEALVFARRFGVLRLHETRDGTVCREPVAFWVQLARRARAILNAAGALHRGGTPSIEDWMVLYEAADQRFLPWLAERQPPPRELARGLLGTVVDEWLKTFDVRAVFDWWGEHPRITFHHDLPSALAMGLVVAVARAEGLALCSACGRPYLRTGRQAKEGQRNYCPRCGTRAAWRYAAGRRRSGHASANRGHHPRPLRLTTEQRTSRLLVLAQQLGAPPRGSGAGVYWQRFHKRALALGLTRGRSVVASRMAYHRAQQRR